MRDFVLRLFDPLISEMISQMRDFVLRLLDPSRSKLSGEIQKDLPDIPDLFNRESLFIHVFLEVSEVAHAPFSPVPARGLSLSPPLILGISTTCLV